MAYCNYFSLKDRDECKAICQEFVQEVTTCFPDLKKKVKIHTLLHLVDNMIDFGPTSAFNTERYVVTVIQGYYNNVQVLHYYSLH